MADNSANNADHRHSHRYRCCIDLLCCKVGIFPVHIAGKFQIRDEEHIVNEEEIRSPKMINLLAYLIIHRNQTLTFYDMADALWQEEETGNPAGALKNLMYRLRVFLKKNFGDEDFILTDHGSYRWNPRQEVAVDAEQFEQMFESAKQKTISEGEAIRKLKAALALYQGDFMTAKLLQILIFFRADITFAQIPDAV